MKIRVVYNSKFGGYNPSEEIIREYIRLKEEADSNTKYIVKIENPTSRYSKYIIIEKIEKDKLTAYYSNKNLASRHDPLWVKAVETIGSDELSITEETETIRYKIEDYDGYESVVFNEESNWINVWHMTTIKISRAMEFNPWDFIFYPDNIQRGKNNH